MTDDIVKSNPVVNIEKWSTPTMGFHIIYESGHTLSVIQEYDKPWFEMAVWDSNGKWLRAPGWYEDVHRFNTLDELNEQATLIIPGYVPARFPLFEIGQ